MSWKSRYGKKKTNRAVKPKSALSSGVPIVDNKRFVASPPGQEMSAALWDFIEPYRAPSVDDDEDQLNKLVTLGMLAWNAAVASAEKAEELISMCLATMPTEAQADCRACIEEMMRRKRLFFANNTRLILRYELTQTPDGPHLRVMSTPPEGM